MPIDIPRLKSLVQNNQHNQAAELIQAERSDPNQIAATLAILTASDIDPLTKHGFFAALKATPNRRLTLLKTPELDNQTKESLYSGLNENTQKSIAALIATDPNVNLLTNLPANAVADFFIHGELADRKGGVRQNAYSTKKGKELFKSLPADTKLAVLQAIPLSTFGKPESRKSAQDALTKVLSPQEKADVMSAALETVIADEAELARLQAEADEAKIEIKAPLESKHSPPAREQEQKGDAKEVKADEKAAAREVKADEKATARQDKIMDLKLRIDKNKEFAVGMFQGMKLKEKVAALMSNNFTPETKGKLFNSLDIGEKSRLLREIKSSSFFSGDAQVQKFFNSMDVASQARFATQLVVTGEKENLKLVGTMLGGIRDNEKLAGMITELSHQSENSKASENLANAILNHPDHSQNDRAEMLSHLSDEDAAKMFAAMPDSGASVGWAEGLKLTLGFPFYPIWKMGCKYDECNHFDRKLMLLQDERLPIEKRQAMAAALPQEPLAKYIADNRMDDDTAVNLARASIEKNPDNVGEFLLDIYDKDNRWGKALTVNNGIAEKIFQNQEPERQASALIAIQEKNPGLANEFFNNLAPEAREPVLSDLLSRNNDAANKCAGKLFRNLESTSERNDLLNKMGGEDDATIQKQVTLLQNAYPDMNNVAQQKALADLFNTTKLMGGRFDNRDEVFAAMDIEQQKAVLKHSGLLGSGKTLFQNFADKACQELMASNYQDYTKLDKLNALAASLPPAEQIKYSSCLRPGVINAMKARDPEVLGNPVKPNNSISVRQAASVRAEAKVSVSHDEDASAVRDQVLRSGH